MTQVTLEAKGKIIELIRDRKPFVPYLVENDKEVCPLIGKRIKKDKLLGSGTDGIVYSIKINVNKFFYML